MKNNHGSTSFFISQRCKESSALPYVVLYPCIESGLFNFSLMEITLRSKLLVLTSMRHGRKLAMKNWSHGCQLALVLVLTLRLSMILIMRIKGMSAYSRFLLLRTSLFLFFMRNMSELAQQRGN